MLKSFTIAVTLGTALITCNTVTAIAAPAKWFLIYSDEEKNPYTYVDLNSIRREANSRIMSGTFSESEEAHTFRYNCNTWETFYDDGTVSGFWTDFPKPSYSSVDIIEKISARVSQSRRVIFNYLCPNSHNPWGFIGTKRDGSKFYLHKGSAKVSPDSFQVIVAQDYSSNNIESDILVWQFRCKTRQLREKQIFPLLKFDRFRFQWTDWHNELPNSLGESVLNAGCNSFYKKPDVKLPDLPKLP
jgi:hypothetical protein